MQVNSNKGLMPSNRKFGCFFSFVFAASGVSAFFKNEFALTSFSVLVAAVLIVITFISPTLLAPFNRLWFSFSMLLGRLVTPLVMGIIFFLLITPVSLVTRLFGRDILKIKKRRVNSYWVERNPAGPAPDSFKHPF
jgi:hypothetical protein